MKQNNCRTKLKAIIAVVLVMASLFAMASLVSAGFVEEVFSEVCGLIATSSNGGGTCPATSTPIYCSTHPYMKTGCTWSGCTCGGHKSVSWGCCECGN